jgi:LysM repeat protein
MAKSSAYDFYLDKCLLPVTPSKMTTKINSNNKTVVLINDGEINILKKAGLTDIDFDCEIPQVKQPYAVYKSGFKGASYFLDYFEDLKTSKKPFQFIVCRKKPNGKKFFNTNIKVSLEDYKITEDAKEGFDLKVKVSLKQYREYGTKTVNIKIAASKPKASAEPARAATTSPAPPAAQTYTVVSGDCLWNIAKKFYGNGSRYTDIYNANQGVIGGNPNLIYPGQVLTIPAA